MLSDHLRRYARACWEVVRPDLGEAGQVAQRELDRLTGDPPDSHGTDIGDPPGL